MKHRHPCTFLKACNVLYLVHIEGQTLTHAAIVVGLNVGTVSHIMHRRRGQHHHISGKYLLAYAKEMAFREDHRRVANGSLHGLVAAAALGHPVSRKWAGYWQR